MKLLFALIVCALVISSAFAETIDLNTPQENTNMLSQDIINKLNDEPLTHCFIDGYEKVGINIDDSNYIIQISDNNISKVYEGRDAVDYSISLDAIELANAVYYEVKPLKIIVGNKLPADVILRLVEYELQKKGTG